MSFINMDTIPLDALQKKYAELATNRQPCVTIGSPWQSLSAASEFTQCSVWTLSI